MEKRAVERVPVYIECHCCNMEYFGIVVNLSQKGMLIRSQKISFPLEPEFDISLPLKEDVFNIRVKVNRLIKLGDYYDGMGVELLNPISNKYIDFLARLNLRSQPN